MLAERLGMTVAQLETTMGASELAGWLAHDALQADRDKRARQQANTKSPAHRRR